MPTRRPAHTPSERTLYDHKLVREALSSGDEKVYVELTSRYYRPVYNVVSKMIRNPDDIEDLTQQAFAKAFHKLSSFNPEYAFATWLFRIATNECIAFLRIKRLDTISIDNELTNQRGDVFLWDIVSDSNRDPQEELIYKQKAEILRSLIEQLPAQYQSVIQQYYLEERTYDEIVQNLNLPLGTIKGRLHTARARLGALAKSQLLKKVL